MTPKADTAHGVRTSVLNPCLDALALNHEQERRLHNPSPEADCLWERLMRIARRARATGDRALLRDAAMALADTRTLVAHNHAEGARVRRAAGWADRQVTRLRDRELNGGPRTGQSRGRKTKGEMTADDPSEA